MTNISCDTVTLTAVIRTITYLPGITSGFTRKLKQNMKSTIQYI